MIEFLKTWAVNIVIVTLFVTFIEILLPNSTMKRYINVILGLVIIIVLINPFINLLSSNIDIEREVFKNLTEAQKNQHYEDDTFVEENNKQILLLYKDKLKRNISDMVEDETSLVVKGLNIILYEDENKDNYGNLKEVTLLLTDEEEVTDNKAIKVRIEEVTEVKVSATDKPIIEDEVTIEGSEKIVSMIAKTFNIPKENITVYSNKKKGGS